MQEEYTYTPTPFSHNTEYLNNSPVSLNEDEIDSRAMHSRFTLQIEKPPSFWDNLSNYPSKAHRYLHHLGTDLKETFNEILHSQSWRNKGMNISLASRISRIRNRVNYPSLNTNNIFYYKNISYHVVSSSNQDIKCSFRNQPENQERTKARKMKKEVEQGYSKFQACCGNEPSLPHACFV